MMTRYEIQDVDDATLVEAMEDDGEIALGEAFDRHYVPVFSLSRHVLRDEGLANEVAQETFLHLWSHPDKFDANRGSLRSYLLAKARGKSIDVLRSETSRHRREERHQFETGIVTDDAVADSIRHREVADRIRSAVADLPKKEREPIERAYFGEVTYREVAEELGIPEGTVKSRIRAGLRRMRGSIGKATAAPA